MAAACKVAGQAQVLLALASRLRLDGDQEKAHENNDAEVSAMPGVEAKADVFYSNGPSSEAVGRGVPALIFEIFPCHGTVQGRQHTESTVLRDVSCIEFYFTEKRDVVRRFTAFMKIIERVVCIGLFEDLSCDIVVHARVVIASKRAVGILHVPKAMGLQASGSNVVQLG
ncbi:hypothetical protein LZ30DRAFT_775967 [Colletotrichum cereale]|nr:hypothetical protein LZ30DRAFT_775967 [Colletotrichum cereale]